MSETATTFDTASTARRRLMIGLYTAVGVLYWMSLYTYVPTLPTYAKTKTEDLALVGAVVSMYGLWQGLIRLPLGIVADWIGRRKPFIVGGLGLCALGAWLMGTAGGIEGLLIGRAVTGLAAGTWVPLTVVFCSLFPPKEAVRAMALLTLSGSVGRMAATAANGSLNALGGYPLAFFLAAGLALAAVPVLIPASDDRRPPRRPSLGGTGRLITRRDVLTPALLAAVSQFATWAATFGFAPILAQELGASDVLLSLMVSINVALIILGNLFTTAVIGRTGARKLVYLTFALVALGTAGTAAAPSLPLLIAAQCVLGLSQGIGGPVMMGMSVEQVEQADRATAMGLHQSVYAILGMFAGPALGGLMAQSLGIRPMFWITAAGCLAIGVGLTWWLGRKQEDSGARR